MQRQLHTEIDLLFEFISATVFGQGNMVFIFFGWVTNSGLVHLGYISYPFRFVHLAVMLSVLLSIYKLG